MTIDGNHITAGEGKGLTNNPAQTCSTQTEVYFASNDSVGNWFEVPYGEWDGVVTRYSTLSIKRELANLGKWAAAKSLMEQGGVWDDYILANYLAANDPVFVAAKAGFVEAGILTQAELETLLAKCVWTAD